MSGHRCQCDKRKYDELCGVCPLADAGYTWFPVEQLRELPAHLYEQTTGQMSLVEEPS